MLPVFLKMTPQVSRCPHSRNQWLLPFSPFTSAQAAWVPALEETGSGVGSVPWHIIPVVLSTFCELPQDYTALEHIFWAGCALSDHLLKGTLSGLTGTRFHAFYYYQLLCSFILLLMHFCDSLEGRDGSEKRGSRRKEYLYNFAWFSLLYSRNQYTL